MSYYDPTVYNYLNLTDEERSYVDVYGAAIEDAGNKAFIIEDLMGLRDEEEDTDLITKMQYQIAEKTIDAVLEYMALQRQEMIVAMIDARPEEESEE